MEEAKAEEAPLGGGARAADSEDGDDSSSSSSSSSDEEDAVEKQPLPWLEFKAEGAQEPCTWWWNRETGEIAWTHPYRVATEVMPKRSDASATGEQRRLMQKARAMRVNRTEKKKRHFRTC